MGNVYVIKVESYMSTSNEWSSMVDFEFDMGFLLVGHVFLLGV